MSGHSKWHNIQVRKGAQDKKRANIFTKLAKTITVAAKEGGDDLDTNFRLRLAVDKAKQANMPKDNIERAIQRGTGGGGGEEMFEVIYEGKGPENIDILVEVLTDNKNRSASEIKSIFTKNGGTLSPGSVAWNFEQKGYIKLNIKSQISNLKNVEDIVLEVMDIEGVLDVEEENGEIDIYTDPKELMNVSKELESKEFKIKRAELIMDPKNTIEVSEEKQEKAMNLLEALDDYDDTQNVYTNME